MSTSTVMQPWFSVPSRSPGGSRRRRVGHLLLCLLWVVDSPLEWKKRESEKCTASVRASNNKKNVHPLLWLAFCQSVSPTNQLQWFFFQLLFTQSAKAKKRKRGFSCIEESARILPLCSSRSSVFSLVGVSWGSWVSLHAVQGNHG